LPVIGGIVSSKL